MEMHYPEPESEVRFRSVRFRSVRFRSVRFRSKQTVTQGKPPYRSVSWYLIFKFVLPYNSIIFYLNTFTRTARKLSVQQLPEEIQTASLLEVRQTQLLLPSSL